MCCDPGFRKREAPHTHTDSSLEGDGVEDTSVPPMRTWESGFESTEGVEPPTGVGTGESFIIIFFFIAEWRSGRARWAHGLFESILRKQTTGSSTEEQSKIADRRRFDSVLVDSHIFIPACVKLCMDTMW